MDCEAVLLVAGLSEVGVYPRHEVLLETGVFGAVGHTHTGVRPEDHGALLDPQAKGTSSRWRASPMAMPWLRSPANIILRRSSFIFTSWVVLPSYYTGAM